MYYDVCVFGGCSLDNMFYQNPNGEYSENPNLIVFGGKGANQAVAASRAGAKTTIISKIGKDNNGLKIIENFKYNNVDTSNIEMIDGLENDYSNIYINIADKDNDIKRFGKAIDSFSVDMIDNHKDVLLNSTIIVSQLKCPIEVTERLINFCYENNKILVLTPCRPAKLVGRRDLIDKISIITCNKTECSTIFETDDIEACVKQYPNKLIVTLGAEGLIYYNGERIVRMPAINVKVEDTTGAGDTLNGNLSYLLSQGLDLKHSLRRTMYASAMKIQKKGAQTGMPFKDELETFIMQCRNKNFEYRDELNFAIELVHEAYFLIKSRSDISINTKEDNTLVTTADLEIEKYLLSKISQRYNKDNFITEETYHNNKLMDRTWIIDPIDGTSHFVNNTLFWGIQLAFYDKGNTKFSIIYLPKVDKFYYAFENHGAYVNNNKILLPEENTKSLNQCIVEFSGSLYKEFELKALYLKKLMENNRLLVSNVIHINSSCVAYTNLASQYTDALIVSTKKLWDIMPGEFIAKESGIKSYAMDFEGKLTLLTKNEQVKQLLLTNNQK